VSGKFGKCAAVAGTPHGLRAKCDDGGGDACKARACDGSIDPKTCAGYANGVTVACGTATCTGSKYAGSGQCDGKGSCTLPDVRECAPYACDQAGCRTGCAKNENCAEGFTCVKGECKPVVATCTEDHLSSVAKDGTTTPCAPYRCGPVGACIEQCASSSDCAPGALCDSTSKVCNAPDASTDSGGCAFGRGSTPAVSSLLGAVALALFGRLSRRGNRASR
jgi:hypothetical protein